MQTRMSASQWAELVKGWESSGESAEAFADAHGVTERTLRWWKSELARRANNEPRRRPPRREPPSPRGGDGVAFASVVRRSAQPVPHGASSMAGLSVVIGSARIVIERGFDGQALREVVRVLEVGQ